MKLLLSLALALLLTPLVSRAADAAAVADEVAVLQTSKGELVLEFWPDVAPKTVANFKKLAASGFYDGTAFHRIIAGFMAQGGDPLTKDPSQEARWGTGDPGYKIDAEFNDRKHEAGVISMARSADPNSAGSQFFLMLGPSPHLDHNYTAFGKVIRGDDTLRKIAETPVTASPNGEPSKPTERVEVQSVKIIPRSELKD
jgi:peptidyl-prolyl cis-trans isomerase B (cyclophilin B)